MSPWKLNVVAQLLYSVNKMVTSTVPRQYCYNVQKPLIDTDVKAIIDIVFYFDGNICININLMIVLSSVGICEHNYNKTRHIYSSQR